MRLNRARTKEATSRIRGITNPRVFPNVRSNGPHVACYLQIHGAVDHSDVVNQASEHAGDSGNSSLFATAMSHLTSHGVCHFALFSAYATM